MSVRSASVRCRTRKSPTEFGHGWFIMNAFASSGAGFLLAVLWFDLMFDVQTRKSVANPLPSEVLASISAYYRRVTTDAYPMNRLVALVMLLTIAVICAEIALAKPW